MNDGSIPVAVICRLAEPIRKGLVSRLKGGDVFDEWLREKLQTDLESVKEQLTAIARTDLSSGIGYYEEGIALTTFSRVDELDGQRTEEQKEDGIPRLLTAEMCTEAKERFKKARKETRRAFYNDGLSVQDRIQAVKFCIKAQVLESDDTPKGMADALKLCKGYLKKLHDLEQVKENFYKAVERRRTIRNKLLSEERKKIISSVCEVNRIVFDITQFAPIEDGKFEFFIWPCVKIKDGKEIDPLRDKRLRQALGQQSNTEEDCLVVRSFGKTILERPHSIATNSKGQFIVVDAMKTKVFNSSGEYRYSLEFPIDSETEQLLDIVDVDTGQDGKAYLLVEMRANEGHEKQWFEVFAFHEQDMRLHNRFKLKEGSTGRKLTVNSCHHDKTEVLVLEGKKGMHAQVQVYDAIHGEYLIYFDGRILGDTKDIAAGRNGHVFVLDSCVGSVRVKCVREFKADRKHVRSFGVDPDAVAITFDRASDHIVIVSAKKGDKEQVYNEEVFIYDLNAPDGNHYDFEIKPVRHMKLEERGGSPEQNVVTTKGRTAVVMQDNNARQGKIVLV